MLVRYPAYTSLRYARALVCGANCAWYVRPINLEWWTASSHAVTENVAESMSMRERGGGGGGEIQGGGKVCFPAQIRRSARYHQIWASERAFGAVLLFKWFAEIIARPLVPVGANCSDFNNAIEFTFNYSPSTSLQFRSHVSGSACNALFSCNFYYSIRVRRTRSVLRFLFN